MGQRSYKQFCALARALDHVGERWTLLLIRDLLTGPKRYTDLLNGQSGMGTNLLADRLRQLEDDELVEKISLSPPASGEAYRLTEAGEGLRPVVIELARWGLRYLDKRRRSDSWSAVWTTLVLHALFDPQRAEGIYQSYEYRVGDEIFHARIEDGELITASGPATDPTMILETDGDTLIALGLGEIDARDAIREGRAQLTGSLSTLKTSLAVFGG